MKYLVLFFVLYAFVTYSQQSDYIKGDFRDVLRFKEKQSFVLAEDGSYSTSKGKFKFYFGKENQTENISRRSLLEGFLPIYNYHVLNNGVLYRFESFAMPYNFDPKKNLTAVIKCTVINRNKTKAASQLKLVYEPEKNNEKNDWRGEGNSLLFNKELIAQFESGAKNNLREKRPNVLWEFELERNEEKVILLTIPCESINLNDNNLINEFQTISYEHKGKLMDYWNNELKNTPLVMLPEGTTYKKSVVHLLSMREFSEAEKLELLLQNHIKDSGGVAVRSNKDKAKHHFLLIRNALLKEEEGDLHILPRLYSNWLVNGKQIGIKGAKTSFGVHSFVIKMKKRGAVVNIENEWSNIFPKEIKFFLPEGANVKEITSDGKLLTIEKDYVVLPRDVKQLEIKWKLRR